MTALDRDRFPVAAAFWRYPERGDDWRLVIASPLVDEEGTLPVYQRIQTVLRQLPHVRLPLREIVAVGEDDPVVNHLRRTASPHWTVENSETTITLPGYAPYIPYLREDQASVTLFVHRLTTGDAAAARASAPPER